MEKEPFWFWLNGKSHSHEENQRRRGKKNGLTDKRGGFFFGREAVDCWLGREKHFGGKKGGK